MKHITKFKVENSVLLADEKMLLNNIYTLDWRQSNVYSTLCLCGVPNCGGGVQLSLRYLCGSLIIFPCFEEYKTDTFLRPFSWSEAIERETIILSSKECLELQNMGLKIFQLSKYPTPSKEEFIKILQWDAPHSILENNYPNIQLNKTLIYAVSHNKNYDEFLQVLENTINHLTYHSKGYLIETLEDIEKITFYIGEPYWEEWTPLIQDRDGNFYLILTNDIAIR